MSWLDSWTKPSPYRQLDNGEYLLKAQRKIDGYVIVPKEPTREMLEAGRRAWPDSSGIAPAVWRAMVAAADK